MIQLLPTLNILKDFNLGNYSNDGPVGCFLVVDLDYSDELHDFLNDYPLAGGKINVTEEMLSEYQLQIKKDNNFYLGKSKKTCN